MDTGVQSSTEEVLSMLQSDGVILIMIGPARHYSSACIAGVETTPTVFVRFSRVDTWTKKQFQALLDEMPPPGPLRVLWKDEGIAEVWRPGDRSRDAVLVHMSFVLAVLSKLYLDEYRHGR